ncbi:two-component system, NarL family, captular synthesis response regulator RcsB [Burkholderia multivorans]
MADTVRIVVADDHQVILMGVDALLAEVAHYRVVARAADVASLEQALAHGACDVLVTDICMPGVNGESNAVPWLQRLLKSSRRPRVVVLTMLDHGRPLAGLLQLGVSSIVDKRDAAGMLTAAIDAAVAGRRFLSPRAQRAVAEIDALPMARAAALSPCEWDVFRRYASGLAVSEIADRSGRSVKTVSAQKRSAMRKLGLEDDFDVICYARRIGLT